RRPRRETGPGEFKGSEVTTGEFRGNPMLDTGAIRWLVVRTRERRGHLTPSRWIWRECWTALTWQAPDLGLGSLGPTTFVWDAPSRWDSCPEEFRGEGADHEQRKERWHEHAGPTRRSENFPAPRQVDSRSNQRCHADCDDRTRGTGGFWLRPDDHRRNVDNPSDRRGTVHAALDTVERHGC